MADEPDYVSLAALREDTPSQAGRWRPCNMAFSPARGWAWSARWWCRLRRS